MRDLAPQIARQRLLMEGYYSLELDAAGVEAYLLGIAAHLGLRTYGRPIVHAPSGQGKDENEGFDAFVPLIDSGISVYVWTTARFFAVVLFTCKAFETAHAIAFTRDYFRSDHVEHTSF